jgi:hypothetical protein
MTDARADQDRRFAAAISAPLDAHFFLTGDIEMPEEGIKFVAPAAPASEFPIVAAFGSGAGLAEWPMLRPLAPRRMLRRLREDACDLLRMQGTATMLQVDRAEPGREILRWRYLSLAMPVNILVAAATPAGRRPPQGLRLLNASMGPNGEVAHQHLHHAAMLSFEELWCSLRFRALLEPTSFRKSIVHQNALCPGLHDGICLRGRTRTQRDWARRHPVKSARHMLEWSGRLFSAFVARGLIERHCNHRDSLAECLPCRRGLATLSRFLTAEARPGSSFETPYPWPEDRFRLARRYRDAHENGRFQRSQWERRVFIREETASELAIVTRAFSHARANENTSPDEGFDRLLLQYLRVKTALFRLLVHPPGEHGLAKFLDHFSQIKVYEPRADRLRPARPIEPGLKVAATEYRVAPDAWLDQIGPGERDRRGKLRPIEEIAPGEEAGEAAWLIHFKRKGEGGDLPFHGRAIRTNREEARRIGNALAQEPRRLRRLRGIDVCGVEEKQPLWVSAEAIGMLRARSCEVVGRRPDLKLEPLRLTLHAGEDFRWLTSGVRAIAEPFRWKLFERGDRIGHGIAVTLHPRRWWHEHRTDDSLQRKRIDRLQDLAFLAAYTEPLPVSSNHVRERTFAVGRDAKQEEWLRSAIEKVAGEIGFEPPARDWIGEAKAFWTEIGGRACKRMIERRRRPPITAPAHEHWLHAYFWSRYVQQQASELLPEKTDETTHHERDLLIKARLRLVRELARWQIPIESNPSSNLVVASLDAMASQDFLAQTPHKKRKAGHETLPWTISTDDPITFATSLADEYAYAWAGMVLREKDPFDPAHARALLEEAAATSMRTRFTLPEPDVD